MKLYATTTSERASKGQGGNNKIEIILTYGNERKVFKKLVFSMEKQGSAEIYNLTDGEDWNAETIVFQKGNKQETAKHHFTECPDGFNCTHD